MNQQQKVNLFEQIEAYLANGGDNRSVRIAGGRASFTIVFENGETRDLGEHTIGDITYTKPEDEDEP